jgi:TRAP-type uncharacterized transport system fused permease subunit
MRIGWSAFILPFAFVATPALLFQGTTQEVLTAAVLTTLGIAGVTAGIAGYWGRRLGLLLRLGFVTLGVVTVPLGFFGLPMTLRAWTAVALVALAAALLILRPKADGKDQPT